MKQSPTFKLDERYSASLAPIEQSLAADGQLDQEFISAKKVLVQRGFSLAAPLSFRLRL